MMIFKVLYNEIIYYIQLEITSYIKYGHFISWMKLEYNYCPKYNYILCTHRLNIFYSNIFVHKNYTLSFSQKENVMKR